MRTTLDIDDDILAAARDLAKAEGKTMGEIISELARKALTTPAGTGFAEAQAAFGTAEWPTLPNREGVVVTQEIVDRILDELDMEDATPWDHDRDRPSDNKAGGWASCPLTENGYLRLVSQSTYPRPAKLADAVVQLRSWAVPPRHAFWPDDVSILDGALIDYTRLLSHKKISDVYLLALAVKHGGRLVTLDTGISVQAARGATADQLVVI